MGVGLVGVLVVKWVGGCSVRCGGVVMVVV